VPLISYTQTSTYNYYAQQQIQHKYVMANLPKSKLEFFPESVSIT